MMYETGDAIRLDDRTLARRLNTNARKLNRIRGELVETGKLFILPDGGLIDELALGEMIANCEARKSQIPAHIQERLGKLCQMFRESFGKDLQNISQTFSKNPKETERPIREKKTEERNTPSSLRSDGDAHDAVQSDFSSDQFYTIPHDWSPSPDHQALAAELGLSTGELNNVREEFIEYWKQRAAVDRSRSAKSERGWECAFGDRLRTASTRWRTGARTGMHADTGRGGGKSAASYAREFASSLRQAQHGDGGAGRVHEGGRDSDVIELRGVSGGGYA